MATGTDGSAAHDILLNFGTLSQHGACWHYVWQAYAAAGASTDAPSTPTAYTRLAGHPRAAPRDRNPPKGAAIGWAADTTATWTATSSSPEPTTAIIPQRISRCTATPG